jgi:CubicO group peptidase (beta-lactamase class C family)
VSDTPVHGTVEPGFEPVYEVFERSVGNGEVGAAACAYVDGRKVVDLWGGWGDAGRTREWQRDTIVNAYSATKGMTATCALRLVERGLLDVDEPVATYWPEFAQAGKDKMPVRMLLSHQAGLVVPTVPVPPGSRGFDWEARTAALAQQAPAWEPGTRCEYHGGTFGYLVGELVRRIDGRPLATFFREEIAEPLGADFMMGFGPEHDHRCAEMVGPDEMIGAGNSRVWRAAADGSATGLGTAGSLARVYAALARGGEIDGVQVLRPETIEAAVQEQPFVQADGTSGDFGLGYQLLWKLYPRPGSKTFGHTGMGGSVGLADPIKRLGYGYVMNQMGSNGATDLLVAIYRSLAA